MKSFFIALILGIFIGSIATNYFSDPKGYQKLQEAKALMLTNPDETPAEESQPEAEPTPPTAIFQVGGKEFKPATTPEPDPIIEEPAPTITEPPAPTIIKEPNVKKPAAPKPQNQTGEFIEQGTKKAEEIAEIVKDKALELAEESKPYIETGIDLTIATAIRAQYKLEKRIDSDALSIKVKNQTVILNGAVTDEKTKQLAIEIAVFTKGVTSVEETLTIAP